MRVAGGNTIDRSTIHRIVVRATNWVGDVVMCVAFLANLTTVPSHPI